MAGAVAVDLIPRVIVADDHPCMLKTVREMLPPRFDVVAAVADGRAALEAAARTNPDLLLTDISMPGLNGLDLARELKQRKSPAKVVFLTAHEDDDYISEALAIGANGYVTKSRIHSDLIPALNVGLAGQYFISPHAFVGAQKCGDCDHVMEFHFEERAFFHRTAESVAIALSKGDVVFMFLSRVGLGCVTERLVAAGVSVIQAMSAGRYIALCIESVFPFLLHDGWPDPRRFEAYFSCALAKAAARARQNGAQARVFSDLLAALLRLHYDAGVTVQVEAMWNDLVRRHSCVVHCGCPAMHLGAGKSRQPLSRICNEHSNVIPIDR